MKAFVVKSGDLFDPKKNPSQSWSVKAVRDNENIPKYCAACGKEVVIARVLEKGVETVEVYCPDCRGR